MSLASLLTDQRQRLDALISLLSNEQNLLTQGDIDGDALAQVAHEKQSLLAELERIETVRRNVQKRLGYDEGAIGARSAAVDAGCQTAWESLLEKSERASRMNELTGQMLSVRMKHNQAMLDYIRQIAEKTLYKPDGRNSAQPGRINASA
ncbi:MULTISPECIES: flagella synthesis protein FlgN [Halomonadaceae]|jgi:flagella synthesis protein FlgN|uniref:Flagellar protein FlgN n=1 Tax=Vreelandella maris TaxID=2729617 RepID=A0A7Y6V954_9GAMM|nr:flagellar protein FlgN [Halomonas maris]NVF14547.1 flagellar protein FlgN [Halomonas maris]|tara:strand:- start:449 stop:898 length:450 start_codon:yes stop_codon:yes gene_type:complete